ncbi:hypothetical protein J6590_010146 [Homalodisca vitripennis]|nr:hypothetical protein J6590_010146 [Homalodisca vitripennis]
MTARNLTRDIYKYETRVSDTTGMEVSNPIGFHPFVVRSVCVKGLLHSGGFPQQNWGIERFTRNCFEMF